MIPKDAGVMDFVKYNIAHRDPQELALQMGMTGSSIGKVGRVASELEQAAGLGEEATQAANKTPTPEEIQASTEKADAQRNVDITNKNNPVPSDYIPPMGPVRPTVPNSQPYTPSSNI